MAKLIKHSHLANVFAQAFLITLVIGGIVPGPAAAWGGFWLVWSLTELFKAARTSDKARKSNTLEA